MIQNWEAGGCKSLFIFERGLAGKREPIVTFRGDEIREQIFTACAGIRVPLSNMPNKKNSIPSKVG